MGSIAVRLSDRPGSAALIAVLFSLAAGPTAIATPPPARVAAGAIPFEEVGAGRVAATPGGELPARPQARILRSASGAISLLRRWGIAGAVDRVRRLDFTRRAAIVVLADERASTGYRARVSTVAVSGATVEVTATVRRPSGINDGQAVSRPWVVVSVARPAVAGARSVGRVRLR